MIIKYKKTFRMYIKNLLSIIAWEICFVHVWEQWQ